MKLVILLRRPAPLMKKKLAPSLPLPSQSLETLLDIADFPDPAAPFSQHIGRSLGRSIHPTINPIISPRVPSRQPETFPMLS
jgi:hypothetical protein